MLVKIKTVRPVSHDQRSLKYDTETQEVVATLRWNISAIK